MLGAFGADAEWMLALEVPGLDLDSLHCVQRESAWWVDESSAARATELPGGVRLVVGEVSENMIKMWLTKSGVLVLATPDWGEVIEARMAHGGYLEADSAWLAPLSRVPPGVAAWMVTLQPEGLLWKNSAWAGELRDPNPWLKGTIQCKDALEAETERDRLQIWMRDEDQDRIVRAGGLEVEITTTGDTVHINAHIDPLALYMSAITHPALQSQLSELMSHTP